MLENYTVIEIYDFYNKINQIHSDVHNLPYDLNIIDWIKTLNLILKLIYTKKENTFWCSALVSYFYVKLGFLNKSIPWTLISPQELSSSSDKLQFENCKLDDDKLIIIN